MRKIKCKVCGTKFSAVKDAMYVAVEKAAALAALTAPAKMYECFDCPKCGCQNAVNVRVAALKPNENGGAANGQRENVRDGGAASEPAGTETGNGAVT